MQLQARTAAILVYAALGWTTQAAAQDPVSYWNERALAAVAPNPPVGRGNTPAVIIDLAMVHAAMHDAVQAYDKRFEPYAGPIAAAAGSSPVAAAKAAHDVLVNRLPNQTATLDGAYTSFLASLSPAPSPADVVKGEVVGSAAAVNIIAERSGDGSFPSSFPQFTGGTAPGEWQPNAGTAGMVSPWGATVRLFALESLNRCQADVVPALTSLEYAEAYNEVKALGSATSTVRTAEQSSIAKTFSGNFLAQYGRLLRDLAAAHLAGNGNLGARARLFALTHIAMTDAFICAWSTKQQYDFWRPVQAIRRGDEDDNPLTDRDPLWTSYWAGPGNLNGVQNPNYPDYTSGANNFTGSFTRMLELFFDSDKPFESFAIYAITPTVPLTAGVDPDPRIYRKFSDVAKDVVDARVYLGIHFRFADTEARSQGRRVANYTFKNFLQSTGSKDKKKNKDKDEDK